MYSQMNTEKYCELKYFLSCWFNQDFYRDYGSPENAIADFVSSEDNSKLGEIATEIEQLISEKDELELRGYLIELGSYYAPWLNEPSFSSSKWLKEISNTIYAKIYI
ncbi:contact-dependent growth inhibition system immunity protein [Aurantivibrio plasticivorans]